DHLGADDQPLALGRVLGRGDDDLLQRRLAQPRQRRLGQVQLAPRTLPARPGLTVLRHKNLWNFSGTSASVAGGRIAGETALRTYGRGPARGRPGGGPNARRGLHAPSPLRLGEGRNPRLESARL